MSGRADKTMPASFTKTEQEIIILKAVLDQINDMVDYQMFMTFERIKDAELHFKSETHQRLFNVLLVDFLSTPDIFWLEKPPQGVLESENSVLFHLKRICDSPCLNSVSDGLRDPLSAFTGWLEGECQITKVWFPSISVECDLRVKRVTFIKICGDIAKHNFTRLSRKVTKICNLLEANGVRVDPLDGYLVVPEFYEWFHDHVFSYHSSAIAEFLNNLRWGIYEYLRPEFLRSFTKDDPESIAYRFVPPTDCKRPTVQTIYWDLMNAVRSEPYMPKFEVTKFLKMRY